MTEDEPTYTHYVFPGEIVTLCEKKNPGRTIVPMSFASEHLQRVTCPDCKPDLSVDTPLGAQVRTDPGPDHFDGGKGVMLNLDMKDPGDLRHSEVYLNLDSARKVRDNLDWLIRALEN